MQIIGILRNSTALAAVSAGAFMMVAGGGGAAEQPKAILPVQEFEIKGSEVLSWDSNPLMLAKGAKSLFGSTTSPELIINRDTPLFSFSADTLINENIYDQSAFDSTDFHENIKLGKHIEQWAANVQGKADYDTARTSELTTYGLNIPKVRHKGFSVTPDISFNPTSVDKITVTANFARSIYDSSAFVDYEVYSLSPSYEHNFNPIHTGVFTVTGQRYQATSGDRIKVDSVGPTAGWITRLTPRFTIRVDAGVQKSTQNTTLTSSGYSQWNYIFDTDLSFKGEQDVTHLVASRAQYPFGNGTETLLTSVLLTESHALNKRISLNGAANYQFAKQPRQAGVISLDKEYGGNAGITYHMLEHWDIGTNYQYKRESLTGVSGNINDHVVLLSLTYHPFTAIE